MIKINRLLIIKIHAVLACFFMPLAILYFISGALYSFDIKGHIDKQVYSIVLNHPFTPDLAQLTETIKSALTERHQLPPKGNPIITKKQNSYEFRWGDLKRLVILHPTNDPLEAELIVRQRSPLTQVMRLHRADAGKLLRLLSLCMVISLIVILASGVYLAVGIPRLRRPVLVALAAGFVMLLPIFL